ncbi:MAG TPA: 2Fe-2S iron-sulfur cluster-binding protein [Vicinamibacteria bacterium]|nr:2Fe-2S iron-sulfur cluster-binding protein [Vicinamibacteria bacterium]
MAAANHSRSSVTLNSITELVPIEVEGRSFEVPSGEVLLSCVHFLVRDETPVLGRFCWANECGNCEMSVKRRGSLFATRERGCQTLVEPGMELSGLTPELRYWLQRKLV